MKVRSPGPSVRTSFFLHKQLAFYQELTIKPRRFNDFARLATLLLAKPFDKVLVLPKTTRVSRTR